MKIIITILILTFIAFADISTVNIISASAPYPAPTPSPKEIYIEVEYKTPEISTPMIILSGIGMVGGAIILIFLNSR